MACVLTRGFPSRYIAWQRRFHKASPIRIGMGEVMADRPRSPLKPRTIAAQALGAIEPVTKAVVLPLHVSTTYIRDPDNQYRTGYIYGRPDNATVRQTE